MTVIKFASAIVAVLGVAQADFRSGSVSTYEKFTYGKFVTRMKTPDKKGTVASFFTYWDGPNFEATKWNELDIEIVPSMERNPFSMNIIYGDGSTKRESHEYARHFNPHDEWHTYAMEWTPKYISWFIDGAEVRHVNHPDPAIEHMAKEQSLRMNFWTPTFHSWGQGLDAADMPWFLLYDYVEVHKYKPESNEFELLWRDDFDTFDDKRWHKASGGFEANSSVFHPDNVSVKAGNLVLKLEPEPAQTEAPAESHEIDHTRRGNLRKERFHREHARDRRPAHDEKFWLHGQATEAHQEVGEADDIHVDEDVHHDVYEEDSSDSEADWTEYQAYLRQQLRDERSKQTQAKPAAPQEKPVEVPKVPEKVVREEPRPESDEHDYEDDRESYYLWKLHRKEQLKEEQYRAHAQRRQHEDFDLHPESVVEEEDYDDYLEHKRQKWEQKEDYRAAKESLKDEKHWLKFRDEGRYWTHVEEPQPNLYHHVEEPIYHHEVQDYEDSEWSQDEHQHAHFDELDKRIWKY